MTLAVFGLILTLLWLWGLLAGAYFEPGEISPQVEHVINVICTLSWLISLAGFICALKGQRKPGVPLAIIGSILFIPIGLLTVVGVQQMTRAAVDPSLEARRAKAAEMAAAKVDTPSNASSKNAE